MAYGDYIDRNLILAQGNRDARVQSGQSKLDKLLRIMAAAANGNNPAQRPVMSAPPTITVSASGDAALTTRHDMVDANGLRAPALNQVAWYGGMPTAHANAYVAMPVVSTAKADGTGGAGNSGLGGANAAMNSWQFAAEILTDATTVEFINFAHSSRKVMYQVDGQYTDLAGWAGAQASNVDNFFKLVFPDARVKRIRQCMGTFPSNGVTYLKAIKVNPNASVFRPDLNEVARVAFGGDSMGEGFNTSATFYPTPNSTWPQITCERLGFRDCRQLAVGSTGYLSDFAGARSKARDQILRWVTQGPFDLIVFAWGYNDPATDIAAFQAEVLYCIQLARRLFPATPMVVLGCQAANGGPNADQIAKENAIAAAVTAMGDALCKFAKVSTDVTPWYFGTGRVGATNGSGNTDIYVDVDNAHDTLAGAAYKAARAEIAIKNAIVSMAT
jgi:hypothetical protein